nr:hypothetical protein L204_05135 [Cryptococcus depauperatus CBS 7855]
MAMLRRESTTLESEWEPSQPVQIRQPRSDVGGSSISGSSTFPGESSLTPSTPPRSASSTVTDSFLGDVAKWKDLDEGSRSGRTSRMIGNKFGLSPPPPPGPPPSNPPPLPPPSSHPFASSTSPMRRQSHQLPTARHSSLNVLRKPITLNRPGSPAGPPPSGALPPLPESVQISRSPNFGMSPPQPVGRGLHSQDSLVSPVRSTPSAAMLESETAPLYVTRSFRPARTPSRHLLQTALDLAQQAVEMDRNNDVARALAAYREAVSRLKSVMERVGLDSGGERGRRDKAEEEGRTLKGIHDAYVARIQLLSSYEVGEVILESNNKPLSQECNSQHDSSEEEKKEGAIQLSSQLDDGSAELRVLGLMNESSKSVNTSLSFPVSSSSKKLQISSSKTIAENDTCQSPRLPSINGSPHNKSLQQAIDEVSGASIAISPSHDPNLPQAPRSRSIGLGHPSNSPSNTASCHARTTSINSLDSTSSLSPTSLKFKRMNRPSLGLDMEADLTGIDGVEMLAFTPTETPVVPQSGGQSAEMPSPQSSAHGDERPLPPFPSSASSMEAGQRQRDRSGSSSSTGSGLFSGTFLVSPSTKQGTISQRRRSKPGSSTEIMIAKDPDGQNVPQLAGLTAASRRASISSLTFGRARTKSQSGSRPIETDLPPIPSKPKHQPNVSISSQMSLFDGTAPPQIQKPNPLLQQLSNMGRQGLRINTASTAGLAPPVIARARSGSIHSMGSLASSSPSSLPPLPDTSNGSFASSTSLMSPLPESQPLEEVLRPFHVLRILRQSMEAETTGTYLTPGIHITPGIWNPSTWSKANFAQTEKSHVPKIVAQDVKIRCMHTLSLCLESTKSAGKPLLNGPRDRQRTLASEDSTWKKLGEEFIRALDELEEEMENTGKMLSKGGVGVNSWKGNKAISSSKSWGSRITRGMDKISNSKTQNSLNTPDRYVDNLAYLCVSSQILAEHLSNFLGPCTPAYASLTEKTYRDIEARIRRSSEFVRVVVVPFVLEDFKQFLLRYLKGGIRYLED